MPRLPRAPTGRPVVIDAAVWNALCDYVERSLNITVSAPLHLSSSASGVAISIDLPDRFKYVDLIHNGGVFGTDKTTAATATFDLYAHDFDSAHTLKLNGSTPLAPINAPFRTLKLQLTQADRGIAIRVADGSYVLWECNEAPANEKDCA